MRESVLQKDERRTGAGVFVLSGAVGDDPLRLVEIQTVRIFIDRAKRNIECARNMTQCKCIRTTHIHDDGFTVIERGFGIRDGYTRDFCLGLWNAVALGGQWCILSRFHSGRLCE